MINKGALVLEKTRQLNEIYPIESAYGSYCGLWTCGKRDGIVSEEIFEEARKYYGSLWHYVGD